MPEKKAPKSTFDQLRQTDRPRGHGGASDVEHAIFAAMERILQSKPAHDVSVAQIIEEAKISRATFYFYFSSKYAVLSGLLAQVMDEILKVVGVWLQRGDTDNAQDALRESLQAAAKVWSAHTAALQAVGDLWRSNAELQELWLGVINRFTTAVAGEIDRERSRGNAPEGLDSKQLAAALIWSSERLLYVFGLGVDDNVKNETDVADSLSTLWINAIYGTKS